MKTKLLKSISVFMILMTVLTACTTVDDGNMGQSGYGYDTQNEETMTTEEDDGMMSDDGTTADMGMPAGDGMNEPEMIVEEDMTDTEMTDDAMVNDNQMVDENMNTEDSMGDTMMNNEGPMAPDFELMDLNGNVYRLSDLRGEKVYIKYWASWCPICLAGLSEIDELSAMDNDFTVLTIVTPNANGEQSAEDFKTWFSALEYDHMIVLLDENGELGKQLHVRAFPTSVFIGSDGVLIKSLPGHESNEQIIETMDSFY